MTRHREARVSTLETGNRGEKIARKYFEDRGYEILQSNWRHGHWEIDLIATFEGILHIIEVKTQHAETAGFPEENVDRRKLKTLMQAADMYLLHDKRWTRIQFDILAVTLHESSHELFLVEDVYL
jgi:putative endonuclease